MVLVDVKESAKVKIVEHIRSLFTLKITLPLGNPNLSLIHTNSFIWLDLGDNVQLANMAAFGKALNSSYSRYTVYTKNKWYVEGVTVNNEGESATMEVELNPFATSMLQYNEDYTKFIQAYDDVFNQKDDSEDNNTNNNSNNSKDNSSFVGGQGKDIDNFVKKTIGKTTDNLKKSKKIHKALLKECHYNKYLDSRCNKDPKKAWKRRRNPGINCADQSVLNYACHKAAGIDDVFIVHVSKKCGGVGHYFLVMKYQGKLYCSDTVGGSRPYNKYWTGCNSRNKFTGKKVWDRKCGAKPC